jgi:hypothetical protein
MVKFLWGSYMLLKKKRKWTLLSLIVIVPMGFFSKFYGGPATDWVNNSLGGVFYEIFWCLLAFLAFPRCRPWIIAVSVLTVTCILEWLQLWHPFFLEWLRSSFIGRTVLGTSFTWFDFPYYFAGSFLGWLWIRKLAEV